MDINKALLFLVKHHERLEITHLSGHSKSENCPWFISYSDGELFVLIGEHDIEEEINNYIHDMKDDSEIFMETLRLIEVNVVDLFEKWLDIPHNATIG